MNERPDFAECLGLIYYLVALLQQTTFGGSTRIADISQLMLGRLVNSWNWP